MAYPSKEPMQDRGKTGKVIDGSAKVRKRSRSQKIADTFLPDDMYDIRSYIIQDVVAPIIKNSLYDMAVGWLSAIFGRGVSPAKREPRPSYRDYYDDQERRRERDYSRASRYPRETYQRRRTFDYETIIFDTYTEADKVLERMRDQEETYGNVSVLEYFDFAGLSCDYTARDFVFKDLRRAKVVWDRDGWVIDGLPRPVPMD